jgi:hypothetical protein
MQANVGDLIILRSKEEIDQSTFIRQTGADGAIDWDFFTGRP